MFILSNPTSLASVINLAINSFFGFLTAIYAQAAHDGRWDPFGHINHHFYVTCNYGIWGVCDRIFQTNHSQSRFPVRYVPSWEKDAKK
jgi:lathosterol oxidase